MTYSSSSVKQIFKNDQQSFNSIVEGKTSTSVFETFVLRVYCYTKIPRYLNSKSVKMLQLEYDAIGKFINRATFLVSTLLKFGKNQL